VSEPQQPVLSLSNHQLWVGGITVREQAKLTNKEIILKSLLN